MAILAKSLPTAQAQFATLRQTVNDLLSKSDILERDLAGCTGILSHTPCPVDKGDAVAWISLQLLLLLLLVNIEMAIVFDLKNERKPTATELELNTLSATSTSAGGQADATRDEHSLESDITAEPEDTAKITPKLRKYTRMPWFWLPVAGQVYMCSQIAMSCYELSDLYDTGLRMFFIVVTVLVACGFTIIGFSIACIETNEDDK
jgi:hypothetical protein